MRTALIFASLATTLVALNPQAEGEVCSPHLYALTYTDTSPPIGNN